MEASILALGVGLLIALVIAGGRVVSAEAAIDHAAQAAARIASLQRTAGQAEQAARTAAMSTLAAEGLRCDALAVVVDASQFGRPLGTPAVVRASISCDVRWSDLGLPVSATTHRVESDFTSPVDQLRERR